MTDKDQQNPFKHIPQMPSIEPAKLPVLHYIDKSKIHFDDPAELMILARIVNKSVENSSPEFSAEQVERLDAFLKTAHSFGNDISELSVFFKEHMPEEFPIINTKGALVDVINDTTKAIASHPSPSEIGAIAQLFRALASLCFACEFIRAITSVAKELDIASTLWEEEEIQSADILRVTTNLKKVLQM